MIPFNKPYNTGKELKYIADTLDKHKTCGDGEYTKKCQYFFENKLGSKKCLLTTSCTDALEMCALLVGIQPGDEVIVPSYTFVSSALVFTRQGATIVFADSRSDSPCIDVDKIEALITPKTKAIVPVHYAGIACDMDKLMEIANKHGVFVIEDAAQAIDSFYKGKPLGSIGHLAAFSFHETKNIQCGEGGLLAVNDERFVGNAEIVWEKGTNRAEFFRGEVNKYGWVANGSSFLPAEYVAAFLWAQLESMEDIQSKRKVIWNAYNERLSGTPLTLPTLPDYATNNAHAFFVVCESLSQRSALISHLKDNGIHSVFHYLSLHSSRFAVEHGFNNYTLPQSDRYTDCLLRLPLFYDLTLEEVDKISNVIRQFFNK